MPHCPRPCVWKLGISTGRYKWIWVSWRVASVINTVQTSNLKISIAKNDKICMLHYAKPLWCSKESRLRWNMCEEIGLHDEGDLWVSCFIMNTFEAVGSLNSWASVFMKVLYLSCLALWELIDSHFVQSAEWLATIYFEPSWWLSILGDLPNIIE